MGYSKEDKALDADVLRGHIFGEHVKDYMEEMQEEAPEKYQAHFAKWIEAEIEPDDIEDLYKSVRLSLQWSCLLTAFCLCSVAMCHPGKICLQYT